GLADQVVLALGNHAGVLVVMLAADAEFARIHDDLAPAGQPVESEMQHRKARERGDRELLARLELVTGCATEGLLRKETLGQGAQRDPVGRVQSRKRRRRGSQRLPVRVTDAFRSGKRAPYARQQSCAYLSTPGTSDCQR